MQAANFLGRITRERKQRDGTFPQTRRGPREVSFALTVVKMRESGSEVGRAPRTEGGVIYSDSYTQRYM